MTERAKVCAKLADDLGAVTQKLLDADVKGLLAREKDLKEHLRQHAAGLAAEEKVAFEGLHYTAMLGECPNQRTIVHMGKLFVAVGQIHFLENCAFPLKKLDELLGAAGAKDIVSSARTGPREVTVVKRARA